jgi:DNA-binding YbaB/EbfC family protein
MEVNALQQMLSKFRQLQDDLQRQVNSVNVEASAGGGMVNVKMNGQKQIVEIRIEPEIFAGKDQEMLREVVSVGVKEASRRLY